MAVWKTLFRKDQFLGFPGSSGDSQSENMEDFPASISLSFDGIPASSSLILSDSPISLSGPESRSGLGRLSKPSSSCFWKDSSSVIASETMLGGMI
jgi:hypothetical protein